MNTGAPRVPAEPGAEGVAERLEVFLEADHVDPLQRGLGPVESVPRELDVGQRAVVHLLHRQRQHLDHVVPEQLEADRIRVDLLERSRVLVAARLAMMAEVRQRAFHRVAQQRQRREGSAEQGRRAQREMPGHDLDLVAAGPPAREEMVDRDHRLRRASVVGAGVHRHRIELLFQPSPEGGAARLLQMEEEEAGVGPHGIQAIRRRYPPGLNVSPCFSHNGSCANAPCTARIRRTASRGPGP